MPESIWRTEAGCTSDVHTWARRKPAARCARHIQLRLEMSSSAMNRLFPQVTSTPKPLFLMDMLSRRFFSPHGSEPRPTREERGRGVRIHASANRGDSESKWYLWYETTQICSMMMKFCGAGAYHALSARAVGRSEHQQVRGEEHEPALFPACGKARASRAMLHARRIHFPRMIRA